MAKPAHIIIAIAAMLLFHLCFLLNNADGQGYPEFGAPITLPGASSAADPCVIYENGTYYLYPTSTGRSIECWTSTNLSDWNYEGVVWGPAPAGAWNDEGVWAPDVFEYQGDYFLYYTADKRIGVAVADNPLGPFVDVYDHSFVGIGHGNTLFYSIDANVFEDDDGRLYMFVTCYIPLSSIKVAPMADPVTIAGPWEVVLIPEVLGWEFVVAEGPWMTNYNGKYYLQYSGHRANRADYAIGYAVADDPMGPYEKFPGNPILATDYDYDFWGPGHHSLVQSGVSEYLIFYHTKQYPEPGWTREIRINEAVFTRTGRLCIDLGGNCEGDDDDDDADDDDDDDVADDDDDSTDDGADDDDISPDDDDDDFEPSQNDGEKQDDSNNACGC